MTAAPPKNVLNGFVEFRQPPKPEAPAPEKVVPFPLTPSAVWDDVDCIIWQVENPKCAFWRGALALGLRHRPLGHAMLVKTSLEELARLIIWSWDNK